MLVWIFFSFFFDSLFFHCNAWYHTRSARTNYGQCSAAAAVVVAIASNVHSIRISLCACVWNRSACSNDVQLNIIFNGTVDSRNVFSSCKMNVQFSRKVLSIFTFDWVGFKCAVFKVYINLSIYVWMYVLFIAKHIHTLRAAQNYMHSTLKRSNFVISKLHIKN